MSPLKASSQILICHQSMSCGHDQKQWSREVHSFHGRRESEYLLNNDIVSHGLQNISQIHPLLYITISPILVQVTIISCLPTSLPASCDPYNLFSTQERTWPIDSVFQFIRNSPILPIALGENPNSMSQFLRPYQSYLVWSTWTAIGYQTSFASLSAFIHVAASLAFLQHHHPSPTHHCLLYLPVILVAIPSTWNPLPPHSPCYLNLADLS